MAEPKTYTCEWCGELFNSRAARLYHKRHTCTQKPPEEEKPVEKPKEEQPQPQPPVPDAEGLTPKEQFEREFGVKIPELDDGTTPADKATFDGENPDIPYIFIAVAAFILMLIAGAVIFRERIIEMLKGKKPPLKPVTSDYIS